MAVRRDCDIDSALQLHLLMYVRHIGCKRPVSISYFIKLGKIPSYPKLT